MVHMVSMNDEQWSVRLFHLLFFKASSLFTLMTNRFFLTCAVYLIRFFSSILKVNKIQCRFLNLVNTLKGMLIVRRAALQTFHV